MKRLSLLDINVLTHLYTKCWYLAKETAIIGRVLGCYGVLCCQTTIMSRDIAYAWMPYMAQSSFECVANKLSQFSSLLSSASSNCLHFRRFYYQCPEWPDSLVGHEMRDDRLQGKF